MSLDPKLHTQARELFFMKRSNSSNKFRKAYLLSKTNLAPPTSIFWFEPLEDSKAEQIGLI